MGQATNEFNTSSVLVKFPMKVLNHTKEALLTTTEATHSVKQVTTVELGSGDIFSQLGYGHFSDPVTQMMIGAIVLGLMLFLVIACLFIRQIPFILRHTPTNYKARTLLLCGVYTIVAFAALVSLIVYRAAVFCDSVCHYTFVLCAYQFFTLILDYAGGESNFIKNSRDSLVFNIRTPPLCCCLRFVTPTVITKRKLRTLRLMLLQMTILQGVILGIFNVLYLIDADLYKQVLPFVVIFMVASIMTGIWALQISSRMIAQGLPEYKIMQRYFAIQLVLVVYKLQPIILHGVCYGIENFTQYKVISKVVENAAIQLIVLLETVFLALFANRVYHTPTKADQPN